MASIDLSGVDMASPKSYSSSFESTTSTSFDHSTHPNTPPQTPPSSHTVLEHHSNSTVPLVTFHRFSQLPLNVRMQIWSLAVPKPRTRFVELHGYDSFGSMPRTRYIPSLPALFSVSREARKASIANEGGELIHFTGNPSLIPNKATVVNVNFYLNFNTDIMFLSSRFTATDDSTESYRLRELSFILPLRFLSRIRRLVVTYSGLDTYDLIGPLLRLYAGLEVLYIGMMDWWSNETVKQQLQRGYPVVGAVADKIQTVVQEVEAEETDDDEEPYEHVQKRLAVRARRRILEVEVRLDE